MNRAALCIKMLSILFSRDMVSITDLADMLETNPRNIPEFKRELEAAGYFIESKPGKYGGYSLNRDRLFPVLRLTDEEESALMAGYDYLLARGDFLQKDAYERAMAKISASIKGKSPERENMTVIPRFPLAMSEEELQARYDLLNRCMKNKKVVEISYRSNDNIVRTREIHPYKLYMYNNGWFVLAFCDRVKDMRFFKLNRILEYKEKDDKFRRSIAYNEYDWLDPFGMKNGDWYEVKLKFTGKNAMFTQDYIYGKDQVVECIDPNTTIFTLKMQYRDNIVGFVLSHMEHCEVLEPQWLKEEVQEACRKVLRIYE